MGDHDSNRAPTQMPTGPAKVIRHHVAASAADARGARSQRKRLAWPPEGARGALRIFQSNHFAAIAISPSATGLWNCRWKVRAQNASSIPARRARSRAGEPSYRGLFSVCSGFPPGACPFQSPAEWRVAAMLTEPICRHSRPRYALPFTDYRAPRTWLCPCRHRCRGWQDHAWRQTAPFHAAGSRGCAHRMHRWGDRWQWHRH